RRWRLEPGEGGAKELSFARVLCHDGELIGNVQIGAALERQGEVADGPCTGYDQPVGRTDVVEPLPAAWDQPPDPENVVEEIGQGGLGVGRGPERMHQLAPGLGPVGPEWLVASQPVEGEDDSRGEGRRLGRGAVTDEQVETIAELEITFEECPA